MQAQIGRWGNSLALRIPKQLADALAIGEGTTVEIAVEDGRLVLVPSPARADAGKSPRPDHAGKPPGRGCRRCPGRTRADLT